MRHSCQKRGIKGWLCSSRCIVARRLRVHGRDCVCCSLRYVEDSVKARNTGYCSFECKTKHAKQTRMCDCRHCGMAFENTSNTTFCSPTCYAKHKRLKASRQCLCCGATVYRRDRRWAQEFCSKRCSMGYRKYESDRKARCSKCGKATGENDVRQCAECRIPKAKTWDRLFVQFLNRKHEYKSKSWDDKLRCMMATNMHREAIAKPQREMKPKQKRKTRRRTVWIDKWNEFCSEMILEHNRDQKKVKDPWRKKLGNWQTNHAKRMRIKEHRLRSKECEQF